MSSENINHSITNTREVSLKELVLRTFEWWNYLLSKWALILGVGVIGGLIGLGYASFKNIIYTATTTFVLEDEKGGGGLGNLAGLASIAGVDLGGSAGGIFQGDNILGLYKSRTMLEQTLLTEVNYNGQKKLLVDIYIDFNELRDEWKKKPGLANLRFNSSNVQLGLERIESNRQRDSVLSKIVANLNETSLSVRKPDKKLSSIEVNVSSKNEFFAKVFNDELVRNVNEFYITTKTKKTLRNVQILQHKTDSVRAVMNGAIYSAVAVADATPNLNPTRQVQRAAPAQTAQFSAETNKSILAEMVKNLELTKMSLLKETPLIQVIDKPIFPLDNNKLGKLKAIVAGGLIGVFFISLGLSIRRVIKKILA